MTPFAAAQCRGWTTAAGFGRYPWSRWRVDTKGASVTLLLLAALGHTTDVRFYPLAAVGMPLHPMVLPGFGHTDRLLSKDLRSRRPSKG